MRRSVHRRACGYFQLRSSKEPGMSAFVAVVTLAVQNAGLMPPKGPGGQALETGPLRGPSARPSASGSWQNRASGTAASGPARLARLERARRLVVRSAPSACSSRRCAWGPAAPEVPAGQSLESSLAHSPARWRARSKAGRSLSGPFMRTCPAHRSSNSSNSTGNRSDWARADRIGIRCPSYSLHETETRRSLPSSVKFAG